MWRKGSRRGNVGRERKAHVSVLGGHLHSAEEGYVDERGKVETKMKRREFYGPSFGRLG
jgi:hypothetical protein